MMTLLTRLRRSVLALVRDPEPSRIAVWAAIWQLPVIRPETPLRPGALNLRIVRSAKRKAA